MRLKLKVQASDAEINGIFNEFDLDGNGVLSGDELKVCLEHLFHATATEAQSQAAAKERRVQQARLHREYASRLQAAAQVMAALEASEEALRAYQRSLPFASRVGLALVKSNRRVEQLIRDWPDAKVGYATLDAFEKGVQALDVPGGYTPKELVGWYEAAFRLGIEKAFCREGGGIQLKHDVPTLIKEGRVATKEERRLAVAIDDQLKAAKVELGACLEYEKEYEQRRKAAEERADAEAAGLAAEVEETEKTKRALKKGKSTGKGAKSSARVNSKGGPTPRAV